MKYIVRIGNKDFGFSKFQNGNWSAGNKPFAATHFDSIENAEKALELLSPQSFSFYGVNIYRKAKNLRVIKKFHDFEDFNEKRVKLSPKVITDNLMKS